MTRYKVMQGNKAVLFPRGGTIQDCLRGIMRYVALGTQREETEVTLKEILEGGFTIEQV